jgi:hypothetical protein
MQCALIGSRRNSYSPLLLSPRIRQRADELGDGEIGRRGALEQRRHDPGETKASGANSRICRSTFPSRRAITAKLAVRPCAKSSIHWRALAIAIRRASRRPGLTGPKNIWADEVGCSGCQIDVRSEQFESARTLKGFHPLTATTWLRGDPKSSTKFHVPAHNTPIPTIFVDIATRYPYKQFLLITMVQGARP